MWRVRAALGPGPSQRRDPTGDGQAGHPLKQEQAGKHPVGLPMDFGLGLSGQLGGSRLQAIHRDVPVRSAGHAAWAQAPGAKRGQPNTGVWTPAATSGFPSSRAPIARLPELSPSWPRERVIPPLKSSLPSASYSTTEPDVSAPKQRASVPSSSIKRIRGIAAACAERGLIPVRAGARRFDEDDGRVRVARVVGQDLRELPQARLRAGALRMDEHDQTGTRQSGSRLPVRTRLSQRELVREDGRRLARVSRPRLIGLERTESTDHGDQPEQRDEIDEPAPNCATRHASQRCRAADHKTNLRTHKSGADRADKSSGAGAGVSASGSGWVMRNPDNRRSHSRGGKRNLHRIGRNRGSERWENPAQARKSELHGSPSRPTRVLSGRGVPLPRPLRASGPIRGRGTTPMNGDNTEQAEPLSRQTTGGYPPGS